MHAAQCYVGVSLMEICDETVELGATGCDCELGLNLRVYISGEPGIEANRLARIQSVTDSYRLV